MNLINQFFRRLSIQSRSKHTQENYRRDLFAFLVFYRGEFLAERKDQVAQMSLSLAKKLLGL